LSPTRFEYVSERFPNRFKNPLRERFKSYLRKVSLFCPVCAESVYTHRSRGFYRKAKRADRGKCCKRGNRDRHSSLQIRDAMAATDSTANNKAGADKKPGADQPADKKAASDAAALAKKLYDDSHPAPKPADKPATPAPAPAKPADAKPAAAKSAAAKPAAPEAPKSHGLMGWLSDTEKSASAVLSNEANQLKETVKADLKAVNAAASSVLAKSEAAVATGESALAKFGTLSITGLTETAGNIEQGVKHALTGKNDGSDKKVSDASKTKQSNELAGAANKQAQSDSKAVPAAPADSTAQAPSEALQATGLLASFANVVSSAASYIGGKMKSGLDEVMSQDTQNALLSAAELYGAATLGVAGVEALPTLIGYAGAALQDYKTTFKEGEFEKGAQKVASLDNVTYASLEKSASPTALAKQRNDDAIIAKAARWFIAGDATPGGAASIARKGNETTADGTTKDGIGYQISSTPEKQTATVGVFDIEHYLNETSIANGDMKVTRTPPITTFETKDNLFITYNSDTRHLKIVDKGTGYRIEQDLNGTTSTKGGVELLQANPGRIEEALPQQLKNGSKMRFAIDDDGNKGAFGADGTEYLLLAKKHQMVVTKDNFKVVIDTLNSTVQLYHKDANGNYILTKPDASTLPKGWQIQGTSVKFNGEEIKKTGEDQFHVMGAVMSIGKGIVVPTGDGPVTMTTDGTNTKVSGADGTNVEATPNGPATVLLPGNRSIVIDPEKGITVTDKEQSVAKIALDGGVKLTDGKTHQESDIDARGNETSYNPQHQQIFSMNNRGDMKLADGTGISHTGAVLNASRNINEPSYNGKTADEVVREASVQASSLGSYISGGSGMEASLASLESTLAMLDSLGDVPGLAEQIGVARGSIEAKIAEVKNKQYLNNLLSQSGKDTSTIEKAFSMRGAGLSDQDIAERITRPQDFAAQGVRAS
jgi:hypothetical protein